MRTNELLEEAARRRGVRARELLRDVDLSLDQALEPLLLSHPGELQLQLGGAIDGLLVRVEVQIAGLAGGGEELLARVLDLLEGGVEGRNAGLGRSGGCHVGISWTDRDLGSVCLQFSNDLASTQAKYAVAGRRLHRPAA